VTFFRQALIQVLQHLKKIINYMLVIVLRITTKLLLQICKTLHNGLLHI